MKKKQYNKPDMQVVLIQQPQLLCGSQQGSPAPWGSSDPNNPYDAG